MRPSAPNRLAALAGAALLLATPAPAADDAARRGEYVFRAANCLSCHTDLANKGPALAGGRALKTPFGTFYGPNITPDPQTGIGAWSEADFLRAMRQGVGPDGRHYYPVFPYPSFTAITDADLADLWAYLRSVPAVERENRRHELRFPYGWRLPLGLWKAINFTPGPVAPDASRSAEWNRGAYLATALGHCGECHTPRNAIGAPVEEMRLAGSQAGVEGRPVPNITPDPATGIGKWSDKDIAFFLELGFLPDGDVVGGIMAEVVENSTRHLTKSDRQAIAVYLKTLPPVRNAILRKQ